MTASRQWMAMLNRAQSAAEEAAVEHCMKRGCPLGSEPWSAAIVAQLQLEHTLRRPGRPRKVVR